MRNPCLRGETWGTRGGGSYADGVSGMTDEALIAVAARVLRPRVVGGRLMGDVGAALVSAGGRVYTGVSVDTPSWGLCAERSAMAAMITAGETRVERLVAVWRDGESGALHVLPPCGVCREFLRAVDAGNLECSVVLGRDRVVELRELLPFWKWQGVGLLTSHPSR